MPEVIPVPGWEKTDTWCQICRVSIPNGYLQHLESARHKSAVDKQRYSEIDDLIEELQ